MEMLKEVYKFLLDNNILTLLVSLVMSFLSMLIVLIKTRTSSIQKKAAANGDLVASDYIVLIPGLGVRVCLSKCKVKLKTLLTKEEEKTYKEVI